MNQAKREEFINELIGNVQEEILSDVCLFPDDWDGIELRWLIRERFNMVVFGGFDDNRSKRYKKYEKYVISNNLT